MKPVYFSICCAIVTHPDQWKLIELRIEKSSSVKWTVLTHLGSQPRG